MNIFFDNNLSPNLAESLHALLKDKGTAFVHLRALFAQDTKDTVWLKELGEWARSEDWIVLSSDQRISKVPHEIAAWKSSGLRIFFLDKAWQSIPPTEQWIKILKAIPNILKAAGAADPGSGFRVHVSSLKVTPI